MKASPLAILYLLASPPTTGSFQFFSNRRAFVRKSLEDSPHPPDEPPPEAYFAKRVDTSKDDKEETKEKIGNAAKKIASSVSVGLELWLCLFVISSRISLSLMEPLLLL